MARKRRSTSGSNPNRLPVAPGDPLADLFLSPTAIPNRSPGVWGGTPHAEPHMLESLHEATRRSHTRSEAGHRALLSQSTPHVARYLKQSLVSPKQALVCLGRQTRKEVLFARNVAGKSGGSPGPYKRTANSKIKC